MSDDPEERDVQAARAEVVARDDEMIEALDQSRTEGSMIIALMMGGMPGAV